MLKEIPDSRNSKENRYKLSEQRFLGTSFTYDWLVDALNANTIDQSNYRLSTQTIPEITAPQNLYHFSLKFLKLGIKGFIDYVRIFIALYLRGESLMNMSPVFLPLLLSHVLLHG